MKHPSVVRRFTLLLCQHIEELLHFKACPRGLLQCLQLPVHLAVLPKELLQLVFVLFTLWRILYLLLAWSCCTDRLLWLICQAEVNIKTSKKLLSNEGVTISIDVGSCDDRLQVSGSFSAKVVVARDLFLRFLLLLGCGDRTGSACSSSCHCLSVCG